MSDSFLAAEIKRRGTVAAFLAAYARELGRQPSPADLSLLLTTWALIARPEQLAPPGDWSIWLILAGRGFGKTRSGAEFIKAEVDAGRARRIALVAPTAADARDVMVEGESGILSLYAHLPERDRPVYYPSKRRVVWPNGAIATTYSAEKPNRLRGPQHDCFWADELAAWSVSVSKKDKASNVVRIGRPPAWDQLMFGLRLGQRPRGVVTTTPRPIPIVRELLKDPTVVVTKGSTYDNAENLAPTFFKAIVRAYEGTRIGRQELDAEVLDDNPNALWKQTLIDELRIDHDDVATKVELVRLVIAIDPAVTSNPESDLTGIVGAGVGRCRALPTCHGELHGFTFTDASGIYTPSAWALRGVSLYQTLEADRIIGEVNNGGDLVEANIRANGGDNTVPYKAVRASRGKQVRAEPVAGLYEQRRWHHVGTHGKLEDEMTQWDPLAGMKSPSRMDALVWAATELMLEEAEPGYESFGGTASRRM